MADEGKSKDSNKVVLSINKLIILFRESLLSVASYLDKAQVVWQNYEELDEIDSISESIFNLIVSYKLHTYIEDKYNISAVLPKYAFYIKDYSKNCCIEVEPKNENKRFVFVMLSSKQGPFDTVICNHADENGVILDRDVEFKFIDVNFLLKFVQ